MQAAYAIEPVRSTIPGTKKTSGGVRRVGISRVTHATVFNSNDKRGRLSDRAVDRLEGEVRRARVGEEGDRAARSLSRYIDPRWIRTLAAAFLCS